MLIDKGFGMGLEQKDEKDFQELAKSKQDELFNLRSALIDYINFVEDRFPEELKKFAKINEYIKTNQSFIVEFMEKEDRSIPNKTQAYMDALLLKIDAHVGILGQVNTAINSGSGALDAVKNGQNLNWESLNTRMDSEITTSKALLNKISSELYSSPDNSTGLFTLCDNIADFHAEVNKNYPFRSQVRSKYEPVFRVLSNLYGIAMTIQNGLTYVKEQGLYGKKY